MASSLTMTTSVTTNNVTNSDSNGMPITIHCTVYTDAGHAVGFTHTLRPGTKLSQLYKELDTRIPYSGMFRWNWLTDYILPRARQYHHARVSYADDRQPKLMPLLDLKKVPLAIDVWALLDWVLQQDGGDLETHRDRLVLILEHPRNRGAAVSDDNAFSYFRGPDWTMAKYRQTQGFTMDEGEVQDPQTDASNSFSHARPRRQGLRVMTW